MCRYSIHGKEWGSEYQQPVVKAIDMCRVGTVTPAKKTYPILSVFTITVCLIYPPSSFPDNEKTQKMPTATYKKIPAFRQRKTKTKSPGLPHIKI